MSKSVTVRAFLIVAMSLALILWVAYAAGVLRAQTPVTEQFCTERSSTYEDGVLVHECSIVERDGQFFVTERDRDGIITERPASIREVAEYQTITVERQCLSEQQSAIVALSTPARDSTLTTISQRVLLIESAIRNCVE